MICRRSAICTSTPRTPSFRKRSAIVSPGRDFAVAALAGVTHLPFSGRTDCYRRPQGRPRVLVGSWSLSSICSALMPQQRAQVVDRVRLRWGLVRAVRLDACEPQRDATGVARRRLHAVERDLDYELGMHEDGDAFAPGLAREELAGLPLEQLIGHPLEGLPDHDETAGARIAGAEVQIRQPAMAAAVPPLGAEHHQIVGAHRLDLAPGLAAPAG